MTEPVHARVDQLVSDRAREAPDRVAVAWDGGQLSYGRLVQQAARVARYLRGAGVGPGDRVGVLMHRGPQTVVALLAVLQAGAAYVPVDPGDPPLRLRHVIGDSGCRVVLTSRALADDVAGKLAPGEHLPLLCLDEDWPVIADLPAQPPAEAAGPGLAFVMYTSGSTGLPKGVRVGHRSIVNLVRRDEEFLGTGETYCWLAALAFDVSTLEIWGALCNGARLVVAPHGLLDPYQINRLVRDHEISTIYLTKGLFNQVVETQTDGLGTIRHLLTGGDALSPAHVRLALERMEHTAIWNLYGPTEATTYVTVHGPLTRADTDGPVPIGRPIAGADVRVVDERLHDCPDDTVGEIVIGGVCLADGYTDPRLTAERFVADPRSGDTLYRTGDQGRRRPDGTIEFHGRVDGQVKLRGFRIELGEVEAALLSHPSVRDACCAVFADPVGELSLAAYVVGADGLDERELRGHASAHLPQYAVPRWFIAIRTIPLTRNGKVDRAALPPPGARAADPPAAATGSVGLVTEVLTRVLDAPHVTPTDNFFALGGNSLLAHLVAGQLGAETGVSVPARAVLDHPTAATLARWLDEARGAEAPPKLQIPRLDRSAPARLSLVQEQVWILQNLYPDSRAYHFQALLRFEGALRVDALRAALDGLVARHEMLRTSFAERDGVPVQQVHAPLPYPLTEVDVRGEPSAFDGLLRDWLAEPFDLTRHPLVRWRLVRLADDVYTLVQIEHHLVHDGWSFNLLLGDLCDGYRRAVGGQPDHRTPPEIGYVDFVGWHRAWLDSGARARQLASWSERLADPPPPLALPTDRPRPELPSFQGSALRIELPAGLEGRLRELARQQGVSLFTVLFAGFAVLMFDRTGQEDFCVGSAFANRARLQTHDVVGMLVNNLPLRVRIGPEQSFAALLAEMREVIAHAHDNQDVPFQEIVTAVAPPRDLARNPLFQVGFSFHDSPLPPLDLPDVRLTVTEGISNGSAKFDLNVIAIPRLEQGSPIGGITLIWEYSTDLFEEATAHALAAGFAARLERVAARPQDPVGPPDPASGVVAASTDDVESLVVAVWEETLDASGIGPADDFFELGGHSLLAIRIAARLRQHLRVELPAVEVMRHRSVRNLAAHLRHRLDAKPVAAGGRAGE